MNLCIEVLKHVLVGLHVLPHAGMRALLMLSRGLCLKSCVLDENIVYANTVCDIVYSYMVTGQGSGSRKLAVSTAVVDRLRRRLRSNGFRAHLTLQMVPEDDDLISNVHITPLRASRALALRFIANKFNLDMERVTVGSLTMLQCSSCLLSSVCVHVVCSWHEISRLVSMNISVHNMCCVQWAAVQLNWFHEAPVF